MADSPTTPQTAAAATTTGSQAPDPLLGRLINDRFKVLSVIARGGMGKVYRAEQSPLGRICALKVLNPNYQGENDPEFSKRFTLEASIASRLHHPNTVTIFDYGVTADNIHFMAMEYLEGRTLHRLIREHAPLDPGRAIHIMLQVCRSLREAHGLGVIHRDLKPANIFLIQHDDDDDYVKVLDFGLVKHVEETGENLTQTGLFMGSPKYMAPEQIRGERVSPATDVYALGVILYEMLSGKVPFDRPNSVNVLMAHVSEAVPTLQATNATLPTPHPLEDVVYRCLAKRAEDRYASMDEFIAALKRTALAQGAAIGLSTGEMMASMPARLVSGERPSGAVPAATTPSSGSLPPSISSSGSVPVSLGSAVIPQSVLDLPPPGLARPTPGSDRPPNAQTSTRRFVILGGVLLALALTLGVAISHTGSSSVPPAPPTVRPPTPPAVPSGASLQVRLDTLPSGADVLEDGNLIGRTPLDAQWTGTRADPSLRHNLTLRHDGYEPLSVSLLGAELTQTLTLRALTPPVAQPLTPPPAPGVNPPRPVVTHRPHTPADPSVSHDPRYNPCFDAQDDSPECLRYRRAHPR